MIPLVPTGKPSHGSGCLLCGKPLRYAPAAADAVCSLCGAACRTNAACEDGHFVCDGCHARAGYAHIDRAVTNSASRDPVAIAVRAMRSDAVNMHGPEHHYLVTAALLAAYRTTGKALDLEKALHTARERCTRVPGGICGLWGSCGAAIGAGIFVSIVTGATPLSDREWSLANKATALCLDDIAAHGGVRCCKRDVFLTLLRAAAFSREHLGAAMEAPDAVRCAFFPKNPTCKKERCPFFPKKREQD